MHARQRPDPVASFWKDPDTVDRFANRDADRRLVELLETYSHPPSVRVLDLGCAGGRNTVLLANLGFDFQAVDGSWPMMKRTRRRIAAICGETAAHERVRAVVMEDLSEFEDESFDLIVALGIYHQASSLDHWHQCVAESARVLQDGGLILVSAFTPASQPVGKPLIPVRDMPGMYDGFSSGQLCLLEVDAHDDAMATHGLKPHVPTEAMKVQTELGYRFTLNALYRKTGGQDSTTR